MIDLADWPRFFIGAIMSLIIGLAIGKMVGLAIDRAILTETDVTIGIFELFL